MYDHSADTHAGGVAFIHPIKAAALVPHIVQCLSSRNNPPKIVHAALKTLLMIYDTATQASESTLIPEPWDQLPFNIALRAFVDILTQSSPSKLVQEQVALVSRLIDRTATADRHRTACVSAGVLDLLAARLAAYYEKQGLPCHQSLRTSSTNLPPAPSSQTLAYILHTITSLVKGSRFRVSWLLYSPFVLSILPFTSLTSMDTSFPSQDNYKNTHPVDAFLPKVQTTDKADKFFQKSFPPLGQTDRGKYSALLDIATSGYSTPAGSHATGQPESAMNSWLMVTLRAERGLCRAEAASLLTTIARAGFFHKSRERQLALFVVPVLVDLVDNTVASVNGKSHQATLQEQEDEAQLRVLGPEVLAFLIKDSPRLQEAAVDTGVIPKVAALLKSTFGYIEAQTPMWTSGAAVDSGNNIESQALGQSDVRPDIIQTMKVRAAALILIAAIADKDDKYRKQIVEAGILPLIVQSLAPLNKAAIEEVCKASRREKLDETYGNTVSVLVAACNAARALSRCINLLRTSMIDYNVGKSIFELLKHSDVNVLISATDVVCNLMVEMSPTRADLVQWGVIKILCDHAHSADSRIRLVSLWALKHLMDKSPKDVREKCLEDLGTGWLVQIITGSTPTSAPRSTTPLYSANAAGERVDLLNSHEEMDTDQGLVAQSSTVRDINTIDIPPIYGSNTNLLLAAQQHRQLLLEIRNNEDRQAAASVQRDDIQIQAQGLDFIRNLIVDPSPQYAMIDVLFQYIGASRLFDIVASKLRAPSAAFDSLGPPQYGPLEIVKPSVYILVHIAAGHPRHRQQLMAQPSLLKLLIPLMQHPDQEIRCSCAWCIINLTWVDDDSDRPAARGRVFELRSLGFEEPLRQLEQDNVLDVREKAGVAMQSMRDFLGGSDGHTHPGAGHQRGGSGGRRSYSGGAAQGSASRGD